MSATGRSLERLVARGSSGPRPPEYILIGEVVYEHAVFLAAFHSAAMEHVSRAIPEGASLRRVGRNLVALKCRAVADAVRVDALRRVVAECSPITAPDPHAVIIARFPSF